jgi:hypothetical protein
VYSGLTVFVHENEKSLRFFPVGKEGRTQVSSIIQLDDKSTEDIAVEEKKYFELQLHKEVFND